jgi:hypothetical protein
MSPPTIRPGEAPRAGNRWLPSVTAKLNRPLSARACVLGWLVSIGLFFAVVGLAGPPSVDTHETIYGTWATSHGEIACAYPAAIQINQPPAAPLYPLLSAGIADIGQIGHAVPFPSTGALGAACDHGEAAMDRWAHASGALSPTLWIGYTAWLALMAGVIAWLRSAGRGRCGWEPATLMVIASLAPVWMCVQTNFHPQDLLAMGLALGAMACARRRRWLSAGVFLALAVLSQQYALLVAVPLFVVAPSTKRIPLFCSALVTGAIVILPLAAMTSGHVIRAVALGTGNEPFPGGTVLWETHASGAAALLVYRIAPLAASLVLSWWVARRLGLRALEPVPLLALVAVSLILRLVFEANLIFYYFMAMAVAVVLLEVTRGSIRPTAVAWLAGLTAVSCRLSVPLLGATTWGTRLQHDFVPILIGGVVPIVIGGAALLTFLIQVNRGGHRRDVWPWAAVAVLDLIVLLPDNAFNAQHGLWLWQIVLVVPGLILVARPLRDTVRSPALTLG